MHDVSMRNIFPRLPQQGKEGVVVLETHVRVTWSVNLGVHFQHS